MKVRLIGINEDVHFDDRGTFPDGTPLPPVPSKITVARLANVGEYRGELVVPYEMVRGAEIGDEFTLHLERVKK